MYLPDYEFEWNEGLYGDLMMQNAMQNYTPSAWGVFKESASYAFHDNSFIHAKDYLKTFTNSSKELTKEEFNEKFGDEPNVKYEEGITDLQAHILQQSVERDKFYARYMKNADILSFAGIGGMIAGSVFDPINYVPFVGWAGRISKVARIASKMPMLSMSANAMLGQTAFEAIKQSHLNSLGKDVNWVGAMVDIGIAGALGGSLGGVGHLSGLASKIKSLDGNLHDQNMSVALTAVADGKNVDNMRVINPDDSATISPSKLDDSNPLLERQTKQQGHEQSFNDKNEIDTVETTFNTDKQDAIKKYNTCRGIT